MWSASAFDLSCAGRPKTSWSSICRAGFSSRRSTPKVALIAAPPTSTMSGSWVRCADAGMCKYLLMLERMAARGVVGRDGWRTAFHSCGSSPSGDPGQRATCMGADTTSNWGLTPRRDDAPRVTAGQRRPDTSGGCRISGSASQDRRTDAGAHRPSGAALGVPTRQIGGADSAVHASCWSCTPLVCGGRPSSAVRRRGRVREVRRSARPPSSRSRHHARRRSVR